MYKHRVLIHLRYQLSNSWSLGMWLRQVTVINALFGTSAEIQSFVLQTIFLFIKLDFKYRVCRKSIVKRTGKTKSVYSDNAAAIGMFWAKKPGRFLSNT